MYQLRPYAFVFLSTEGQVNGDGEERKRKMRSQAIEPKLSFLSVWKDLCHWPWAVTQGMLHFEFLNLLLIRGRRLPWSAEMNQAPSLSGADFTTTTTTTPNPHCCYTQERQWNGHNSLHAPGETFLMRLVCHFCRKHQHLIKAGNETRQWISEILDFKGLTDSKVIS